MWLGMYSMWAWNWACLMDVGVWLGMFIGCGPSSGMRLACSPHVAARVLLCTLCQQRGMLLLCPACSMPRKATVSARWVAPWLAWPSLIPVLSCQPTTASILPAVHGGLPDAGGVRELCVQRRAGAVLPQGGPLHASPGPPVVSPVGPSVGRFAGLAGWGGACSACTGRTNCTCKGLAMQAVMDWGAAPARPPQACPAGGSFDCGAPPLHWCRGASAPQPTSAGTPSLWSATGG